jgi:hypothetical protein
MDQKLVSAKDSGRLRRRLKLLGWGAIALFALTLVVPVKVTDTSVILTCVSGQTQLGRYLLGSSFTCLDIALGRLVIYAGLIALAVWVTSASVAERGWKGLYASIFTPDGNNSPAWTLLFYLAFLLATAANVKFTFWPNFIVATVFYLSRNVLIGMVFSWAAMRLLKINSVEAYLREQVAPFSDGLPILQAIVLLLAFYLPRVFGG